MKNSILFVLSAFTFNAANAVTTIDLKELPQAQVNAAIDAIKNDYAPFGASVKNPRYEGFIVLDDDGYLSEVVVEPLKLDISFLFFTSKAELSLHGVVDKECKSVELLKHEYTGTNNLIDSAVRSKVNSDGPEILLKYIVHGTDIGLYCQTPESTN